MASDKKIEDITAEYESQITELENLLFNPSQYREAFALNSDKDLFEIIKEELVDYVKKTPEFKKFLMKSLDLTSSKSGASRAGVSPPRSRAAMPVVSVVSPAIFSPRRSTNTYMRGSSRPVLT